MLSCTHTISIAMQCQMKKKTHREAVGAKRLIIQSVLAHV